MFWETGFPLLRNFWFGFAPVGQGLNTLLTDRRRGRTGSRILRARAAATLPPGPSYAILPSDPAELEAELTGHLELEGRGGPAFLLGWIK